MIKYYKVITYGCQMNVHESEKLSGMLESLEYINTEKIEKADIIVFNTCTIRAGAVDKAFGNIGALKKLKKRKPELIIAVGGCMTQNKEDAIRLKKTFPFVDIIFGTHNLHKFKQYVIDYRLKNERILNIWDNEKGVPNMTEINRTSGLNAWVNIMYGCNNFCSYCIVPYVRGRERSRDLNELIDECKQLVKGGYKSITLLGQNVNSYGNNLEDTSVNFANLLKQVAQIEGDFKVKFMTSHPKDLTDEVIDVIASQPRVSKAVHLPVQSGSNAVLEAMNRGYTIEHYKETAKKIKEKIENVALSSDFIVGFPGETEDDFEATKKLVKETEFDVIFAYMYSVRSGTKASEMTNQIDFEIKNRRVNELLAVQKSVSKINRQKIVGKELGVLVEKFIGGKLNTKTDGGRLVIVKGKKDLVGTYIKVKVLKIENKKTIGKII
jgi:tRNA-2-methylthio-N6-dimethylallyladenosine synthase